MLHLSRDNFVFRKHHNKWYGDETYCCAETIGCRSEDDKITGVYPVGQKADKGIKKGGYLHYCGKKAGLG